jgi:hypothetical protein
VKYSEQLQRPEWRAKRLRILKRDGGRCTKCKTKKSLHVHHLKYISGKMAWEVPDDYLVVLCAKHHEEAHFGKPITDFKKGRKVESKEQLAFRMALQNEINKHNRKGAEFQKVKRKDVPRIMKFMEKRAKENSLIRLEWERFKTEHPPA